ncbi:hypothetical protein L218DRAFT_373722 [Marasmius fiardii PR-910]|nr:hypothetical protein L218DRAFT_373722 [Marasmius fiardii PR-910]
MVWFSNVMDMAADDIRVVWKRATFLRFCIYRRMSGQIVLSLSPIPEIAVPDDDFENTFYLLLLPLPWFSDGFPSGLIYLDGREGSVLLVLRSDGTQSCQRIKVCSWGFPPLYRKFGLAPTPRSLTHTTSFGHGKKEEDLIPRQPISLLL